MANGADIAKAYVQIIPSADGIQGKLTELMGGEAEQAGKSSGGKFGSAMGKALKVGGAVAGAFAGATAAVTGAVIKGASATADYGDNIDKMSQKLGMSSTAYQKWDYVLSQSGADINSMGTGLKTLTNKLDDAKNGSESAQEMFSKLGLSMEDLNSMSREEIFAATVEGFQGMADSTERAALANDLFGKSGQELTPLFNTSVEDTAAMMAATEELGMIMSEDAVKASADYKDALDTMQRTFGGLKNSMMSEFMPSLTTVMDGLTKLMSGDSSGIGQITEGINQFVENISQSIPTIMDAGSQIILALIDAIIQNLPTLLTAAGDAIMAITEGLIQNLPTIIESGLQVLLALAMGIAQSLPTLIPTIVDVVIEIVETLIDNVDMLVDAAIAIMVALAEGLINALPRLIEKAPELVGKLVDAIVRNAPKLLSAAVEIIAKLVQGISQNLGKLLSSGQEIVQKIVSGIGQLFGSLRAKGAEIVNTVSSAVRGAASSLISAGMNIVQGIWQGISNGFSWITSRIRGWVGNVISYLKRLLKIGSPSKLMADEVGRWMAAGIGVGFEDEMSDVERMMQSTIPGMSMSLRSGFGVPSYNYGGVTINILGRGKDADQLAVELQEALIRRFAAWA